MARLRLGEMLVQAKLIQPAQLEAALHEQKRWGGRLGDILVRMTPTLEEAVVRALSKQLNVPVVDLRTVQAVPPEVLARVPEGKAEQLAVLPLQLREEGKVLAVAMAEPENIRTVDALRALTHCRILPYIAGRRALAQAHERFYRGLQLSEEDAAEGSFHLLDAGNRTVTGHRSPFATPAPGPAPTPAPRTTPPPHVQTPAPVDTSALLEQLGQVQRAEVAALKALVELMIEKGVFTRQEYLAKVKR